MVHIYSSFINCVFADHPFLASTSLCQIIFLFPSTPKQPLTPNQSISTCKRLGARESIYLPKRTVLHSSGRYPIPVAILFLFEYRMMSAVSFFRVL